MLEYTNLFSFNTVDPESIPTKCTTILYYMSYNNLHYNYTTLVWIGMFCMYAIDSYFKIAMHGTSSYHISMESCSYHVSLESFSTLNECYTCATVHCKFQKYKTHTKLPQWSYQIWMWYDYNYTVVILYDIQYFGICSVAYSESLAVVPDLRCESITLAVYNMYIRSYLCFLLCSSTKYTQLH